MVSEAYPELWPLLLGGLFVVIVLFLPKGVIGSLSDWNHDKLRQLFPRKYRQTRVENGKEAILWKAD
jgi:urea transport system permease protein